MSHFCETINVPYWGRSKTYPSVTLRMDFRNPDILGTFVYHCHLLEHEDGGMMGIIQVLPRASGSSKVSKNRCSTGISQSVCGRGGFAQ
jgi:hypothetical protein